MKKLSKLLLALSFVLSITTSAFAVTVVSWGGAYTESQKLGYGDPTAAKLGIPVNWVDYTGGLSEIKAQKEAGKITKIPQFHSRGSQRASQTLPSRHL
jgi:putative spermidine/putrescine transport system substrate-binding protein